jgi:hypothetical protein
MSCQLYSYPTKGQRSYWHKATNSAVDGEDVYVLAKRYTYKGAAQIEAQLHIGPGLQAHLSGFEDTTQEGVRLGSDNKLPTSTDQFTFVVPVGKAIAAALKSLP